MMSADEIKYGVDRSDETLIMAVWRAGLNDWWPTQEWKSGMKSFF